MLLSNLTALIKGAVRSGPDADISGIAVDSRIVKRGFLFIAIKGIAADGHAFIGDALARGATAIVIEATTDRTVFPTDIPVLTVPDARTAASAIAAAFYPRQPQTVAAVTGTSGKTSTVQFTRELWERRGRRAASIGTLGLVTPEMKRYGSLTTPDSLSLHKTLNEITDAGITHAAIEASSHGIELHRLDNVRIAIGAFTNLSRDHLDYHGTMERYLAAKMRLFTHLIKDEGTAVLNADAPEFHDIREACESRRLHVMCFGNSGCHLLLKGYIPEPSGQRLRFELLGAPYEITLPLIGTFQIWNALCALLIAAASGEDKDALAQDLGTLKGVPGRLEKIGTTPSGGTVFVDYAHKPAALENALEALKPHVLAAAGAKLRVVFGCGGNRDAGKRPLMGAIAERLADEVIVTDDNPRREKAPTIRQEILAGCVDHRHVREIGDRAEAIRAGIESLKEGDVLVIAGKGHEEGQIIGNDTFPFNDADEARKVLDIL